MDMSDYQWRVIQTNTYSRDKWGMIAEALGIVAETGEMANKIKETIQDNTNYTRAIIFELGDILWYISQLANDLGYTLNDIAYININELKAQGRFQDEFE